MNNYLNKITCGDCLELMRELTDGCVDMVFADLPYGVTKCDWDVKIDLPSLWVELNRIVKPHSPILMTATQPFTSELVLSNSEWYKYEWIWNKKAPSNPARAKKEPLRIHESILVFGKDTINYYPILDPKNTMKKFNNGKRSKGNSKVSGSGLGVDYQINVGYPKTILEFTRPSNLVEGERFHPSQKPLALLKYLIQTYTKPNKIVLDCVMGSGTTAVAAIETGRQFIGFELSQEYCKIAEKRIAKALLQQRLF